MLCLSAMILMTVTGAAPAVQVIDKEQAHQRMAELVALRDQARVQGDDVALLAAADELSQISASLGGDLPSAQGQVVAGIRGVAGIVPNPPAGSVVSTAVFTESTAVVIPTGPAVVSSTLVVSGVDTYLWDIDVETFITHTFAADLDITLQSPAGTVVTLTTDNGGGNDDVFNGTVWDDQANPGGQVPYTSNNGLVTDHVYANNVLASPLVPEEALAAFKSEDPNGVWTLTISDDTAGDGGNLASWSLSVHTLPTAPVETTASFANNTPVAIPAGPAVVSSTVAVTGMGAVVTNVRLTTFMPHTFAADLDVTLQSPAGTVVTLTTDNGGGNDNVFDGTLWDDKANPGGQVPYVSNNGLVTDHVYVNLVLASPLVPEEAMGAFLGEDPNGTWTLTISDDAPGDAGSLNSWTLEVTTGVQPCELTCPGNVSVPNAAGQCSAPVNFAPPATTGFCDVVICNPTPGSAFPVGDTQVTCTSSEGPSCDFQVNVFDNELPTLGACPANQLVAATSAAGALLNFTPPSVTDNCPGVGAVVCAPPSGSTFPIGVTLDTCSVSDAAGNPASCNFNVQVEAPDVSITKSVSAPDPVSLGDSVVFTLTVTNNNALVAATGVTVVDPIAQSLSYQSNDCGAAFAGGTVTWNIGTLAPLASQSCEITATVVGAQLSNTASVSSTSFDPNSGNNSASIAGQFIAVAVPALGVIGLLALIGLLLMMAIRRQRLTS